MTRHPTQGFTLLPTLAALLLLAALVVLLQSRSQSNLRLLSRLTADLEDQLAKDALYDRLRTPIAEGMAGGKTPALDGTPFILSQNGRTWEVRLQDVEGLVDLYLAAPDLLSRLPADTTHRSAGLTDLPPGQRYPVLPMTLAQFGIDAAAVEGLVTQSGQTGFLRLATQAADLRPLTSDLVPGPREGEQITQVAITIRKLP
ncbi:hypothetical protein MCELHM10_00004 [Paracoccaceae bacterium]